MPAPPKVDLLPVEIREELDNRIASRGFSGYVELSAWLAEQGFSIGKSALAEHGGRLERRIQMLQVATKEAEALVAASPDDTGAMAEAVLRITQERIFQVMMAAEEGDLQTLASAGKAVAETARAGIALRDARRKAKAEVKAVLEKEAKRVKKLPKASVQDIADGFLEALSRVPEA